MDKLSNEAKRLVKTCKLKMIEQGYSTSNLSETLNIKSTRLYYLLSEKKMNTMVKDKTLVEAIKDLKKIENYLNSK